MGSKTRLGSYCTKRANNGVNLVTSRNINTRLARPIDGTGLTLQSLFVLKKWLEIQVPAEHRDPANLVDSDASYIKKQQLHSREYAGDNLILILMRQAMDWLDKIAHVIGEILWCHLNRYNCKGKFSSLSMNI